MPLPPQSGGPASRLCAAAGPGPWGSCWAIPPGCGRRHGERGRAGSVLGWGGGLQEGKGQPRIGWGRVRGGSAAGGGAGVPTRGRGSPGGEGLFRGATPAGGGSLSAARRRDPDKGDGGGRRPLCGKRVSPPPLLAPHRRLQFRVLGRPPGSSGHFSVFKNNGGGGCPGSPQGSQEGSGGVGMGSGDVWGAFGRWGNQGRAAAFGAGFRRR